MIMVYERLRQEGLRSRLILQIHDELIFSVPEDELKNLAPELKRIMENCVKLNIPLICDMAYWTTSAVRFGRGVP